MTSQADQTAADQPGSATETGARRTARIMVTGASTGIGRATVDTLAGQGALVWAGVRREEDAAALEAAHPGRVRALRFDLTVGQLAVTQAVLPALRAAADARAQAARDGRPDGPGMPPAPRIVMIGSIGDRMTSPIIGGDARAAALLAYLPDRLRERIVARMTG